MSFLKFAIFRILGIIGRIIALCGGLFLILAISSQKDDAILMSVGILAVGILLSWFGGFREDTTVIERGARDGVRGGY